jgi:hypothetical protein
MRFLLALPLALLAGCGGVDLWPFGSGGGTELSRKPAGAAEYRCDGNKVFYVRKADDDSVWLTAPDREIRLPKIAQDSYGVARVVLDLRGGEATLVDPPASFSGCKRIEASK